MSDFHCSPSANITSGSLISGMDGNPGNSFRILRYSSILFYAAMVTCDLFITQVESVFFVFDTPG